MMEILNLRKTKDGYLANGYIPLLENDSQVVEWVELGKEVMPMLTDDEIFIIELAQKVQEAKSYLQSTDFKMTVDYYATLDEQEQAELTYNRAKARTFLKEQGL